jgi:hypothetical protein
MKILLVAFSSFLIFGCASTEQERAASSYSLNKVTQAAGEALQKVRNNTEFYLSNIPPGTTAEPKVILKFIRDCHSARQAAAIASDRLDGIYDVVQAALSERKEERFDGLVLVIVSAKKAPERFDALLLPRGIVPVYATY